MIQKQNNDKIVNMQDQQIIMSEAMRLLREKWKTYNRALHSNDENMNWLSGYRDLLKDAGINRYIALRVLKGEL